MGEERSGVRADEVADLALPLSGAADLDPLVRRAAGAHVVMLGEASHGTHEFYRWRAALTRRLIEEHGFSFVAVEGDWPDCERVDRSVRGKPGAPDDPRAALEAFDRWPTWMWANEEVVEFCRWLRAYNADLPVIDRVGFHGLDVYSLWESLREILLYLREHDPAGVPAALAAYRCFEPYQEDARQYAMAARFLPVGCEDDVIDLLVQVRRRAAAGSDDEFDLWQNAEIVAGAERYYRTMVGSGRDSWNVRERHMAGTLDRLMEHYGPGGRAVVWAHNTHVGDVRATDRAAAGELTIGQLARERYGAEDVVLAGFGCHRGTVIAAESWDAPTRALPVPPARPGSVEDLLHRYAPDPALFVFPPAPHGELLTARLGHRAIGVVYHPAYEQMGNYVPTTLGERYDAFLWFDQTAALHPLHVPPAHDREPETYPTGV
jgi:erythromycin esterase